MKKVYTVVRIGAFPGGVTRAFKTFELYRDAKAYKKELAKTEDEHFLVIMSNEFVKRCD